MSDLTERKFSFSAAALAPDTFAVVDFTGEEGLSRPYRFEIRLAAEQADLDLAAVMAGAVRFTIHRPDGDDAVFSGILASFEQQHAVEGVVFYRAVLVPRLWWLSLTHHQQVFLNRTVKEMLAAVLEDGGLTTLDYEFRLQDETAPQPFVCQYAESHLAFIERRAAREGIYYFFEQTPDGEKVIFTDTAIAHRMRSQGETLTYAPPSGLGETHREETVHGFVCRRQLLPKTVTMRDTNYMKPSLAVTGTATVDPKGRGEHYVYGAGLDTPKEAGRLAAIVAQSLSCRGQDFIGQSTVPYVMPGFTFQLQTYPRSDGNRRYLTIDTTHGGSQTGYLTAGIQKGLSDRERRRFYENRFTAIPAEVQFRPPQPQERPVIEGMISARIDAAGSGTYAELDEMGRYKVILPFDTSGRKDGKASTWLRMASPYAGAGHGMHFPLHKGTEVLISFLEGNPDRPVIAAAVPNPETAAVVTGANQTMAALTTAAGTKIHMEDKAGSERILMHAPNQKSFIRIGAPNDPATGEDGEESKVSTHWGIAKKTDGWIDIEAKAKNEVILGQSFDWVTGPRVYFTAGLFTDIAVGGTLEVHAPEEMTLTPFQSSAEMSHLGAHGTQTVTALTNTRMDTLEESVRGDVNSAVGSHLTAVGTKVETVAANVRGTADKVTAALTATETNGAKLQAVEDKLAATATALDTAGASLKTAGSFMKGYGIFNQNAGTDVEDNGSRLEAAGTDITDAGVILEGL